jgi:predicted ribosome quality control (RQC) complex YloA/Tae2 family protein
MVAELESIREELHEIIDESETDSAFKTKSKQQIDARIEYIKNLKDPITNVQKIFMAQALRERVLVSIVIQQQVYEIRDIIDAAIEEGLSENFGQMLHEIVDRLQERLDVTASDTEKYEDIRQTRKEIEKLIEEELLKMEETIDKMEQDNEDIKEELEKTENETLQDIADKMEQVEEK